MVSWNICNALYISSIVRHFNLSNLWCKYFIQYCLNFWIFKSNVFYLLKFCNNIFLWIVITTELFHELTFKNKWKGFTYNTFICYSGNKKWQMSLNLRVLRRLLFLAGLCWKRSSGCRHANFRCFYKSHIWKSKQTKKPNNVKEEASAILNC